MPIKDLDEIHEQGWIYSIRFKKDDQIIYVGHSFNLYNRIKSHKSDCYNPDNKKYNQKNYQIMRSLSNNFDDFYFYIEEEVFNITRLDIKYFEDKHKQLLNPCGNTDNIRPEIMIHKSIDPNAYNRELRRIHHDWYCQFCDSISSRDHKARHERTKKHIENFIQY